MTGGKYFETESQSYTERVDLIEFQRSAMWNWIKLGPDILTEKHYSSRFLGEGAVTDLFHLKL